VLQLSGKVLSDFDGKMAGDQIKIYHIPSDHRFIIIHNAKAYDLVKLGSFLIWDIPGAITADPIRVKVQALDPVTNTTRYITNELAVRRNIDTSSPAGNSYDADYPIYPMFDDHPAIRIEDRKILMPKDYKVVVSNDNVSQMITFDINRYFNNVDLSKRSCAVKYINANGDSGKAIAMNVYKTEKKLFFGWLLDVNVTGYPGTVKFACEFTGYDDFGQFYAAQTITSEFKIEEGLIVNDNIVIERYPSIIESIQNQLVQSDEKLISHNMDDAAHVDIREQISNIDVNKILADVETKINDTLDGLDLQELLTNVTQLLTDVGTLQTDVQQLRTDVDTLI
jgi:hypothetical protein